MGPHRIYYLCKFSGRLFNDSTNYYSEEQEAKSHPIPSHPINPNEFGFDWFYVDPSYLLFKPSIKQLTIPDFLVSLFNIIHEAWNEFSFKWDNKKNKNISYEFCHDYTVTIKRM